MARRPTFGGLVFALLFWWQSLSPTLLPRAALNQAALSALCLTVGYAFGTLVHSLVVAVLRRADRQPSEQQCRWATWFLAALAAVTVAVGLPLWLTWQNDQRALLDMEDLGARSIPTLVVLTVVLSVVLMIIGRLLGGAVRGVDRWNQRHLPRAVAQPLTVVLILVLSVFVLREVAFTRFTNWASTTFGAFDEGTPDGVEQPTSPAVSGSPESLIEWESLGLQGRRFAGTATSVEDLEEFHGPDIDVEEPVRIYAGLRSAESPAKRAELAVQDLDRAGGFDREVLVVASSTGTGWIDPDAAEALEQLHHGDTAIVSMQYSYMPSWISFITDLDLASEASAELYDAVYDHWSELPEAERPTLLVYGLSLGAFGAESAFAGVDGQTSIANITARSDGALFVGPPHASPITRQLTAERDPGSPVWAPIIGGGETVRFLTRDPDQVEPAGEWKEPRVLFIQHPSDPVTYWSLSSFWSEPEWMDDPRGFDVPDGGSWFPFVGGAQGVFDLAAGFAAPPGHGHDYRLDYVDGWARIAAPAGWKEADTERLELFLFPEE